MGTPLNVTGLGLTVICTLAVATTDAGAGADTVVGADAAVVGEVGDELLDEHAALTRMAAQARAAIGHLMVLIDMFLL